MSIVYLNGDFLPIEEAKISPLDRGFLFGDGIYDFIPTYSGKSVGFDYHINRMLDGLKRISLDIGEIDWNNIIENLLHKNEGDNLAVYIQVSRGADVKRTHNYPAGVKPTIFIMTQPIAKPMSADKQKAKGYSLVSTLDRRWDNCHIKSTSLLGNVLHFQYGYDNQIDETLLYNNNKELTECSACNVFVVKGNQISTPILDQQILPGITRRIVIDAIKNDSSLTLIEGTVTLDDARNADELWITSSSKQIAPVVQLDGKPVGDGKVGEIWEKCTSLFNEIKYD